MKKILKIYALLKVIVLLMKKSKHQKKIKQQHQPIKQQLPKQPEEVKIGSFKDQFLKADISVKGKDVKISVGGFYNELDAIMWARMQTELWLNAVNDLKNNDNSTLH